MCEQNLEALKVLLGVVLGKTVNRIRTELQVDIGLGVSRTAVKMVEILLKHVETFYMHIGHMEGWFPSHLML